MPTFLLTSHIRSLSRIFSFAEDIIRVLESEPGKEGLLDLHLLTLDQILIEHDIVVSELPPEKQEKIKEIVENEKKLISDEYPLTIINQSLSIMCSLFETFLINVLEIIFASKNETLLSLSEKREIKLEDIIRLGTFDKVISYFKYKTLKSFINSSTKEQFKKYFEPLSFDISKFFDMSRFNIAVQKKFRAWNLDTLKNIFDERHDIVHNMKFPLRTLNELEMKKDFFEKIMINISIEIYNKFSIPNDLDLQSALKKAN